MDYNFVVQSMGRGQRNFISSSIVLHNEFSVEEEKLGILVRNTYRDSDVFAGHLHIILVSSFGPGDLLPMDLVNLSEIMISRTSGGISRW